MTKPKAFVILQANAQDQDLEALTIGVAGACERTRDRCLEVSQVDRVRRQPAEDRDRQDTALPAARGLMRDWHAPGLQRPAGDRLVGAGTHLKAPTIVLLHEGLGCVALWRDVPAASGRRDRVGRVRLFAVRLRAVRRRCTLPRPMTYMHHEAQVVLPEVLALPAIGRAVLVGHFDGGSIAAIAGSFRPA